MVDEDWKNLVKLIKETFETREGREPTLEELCWECFCEGQEKKESQLKLEALGSIRRTLSFLQNEIYNPTK